MKIRIKGNSLRYRLTKSDIDSLAKTGYLQEQTAFAASALVYTIKINNGEKLSAIFENNTITLFMPTAMIEEMVNTDKVGFSEKNDPVQLLVEKDFTCLDNVDEDQGDNYPNPLLLKND